jgi:hypothetical protein
MFISCFALCFNCRIWINSVAKHNYLIRLSFLYNINYKTNSRSTYFCLFPVRTSVFTCLIICFHEIHIDPRRCHWSLISQTSNFACSISETGKITCSCNITVILHVSEKKQTKSEVQNRKKRIIEIRYSPVAFNSMCFNMFNVKTHWTEGFRGVQMSPRHLHLNLIFLIFEFFSIFKFWVLFFAFLVALRYLAQLRGALMMQHHQGEIASLKHLEVSTAT